MSEHPSGEPVDHGGIVIPEHLQEECSGAMASTTVYHPQTFYPPSQDIKDDCLIDPDWLEQRIAAEFRQVTISRPLTVQCLMLPLLPGDCDGRFIGGAGI